MCSRFWHLGVITVLIVAAQGYFDSRTTTTNLTCCRGDELLIILTNLLANDASLSPLQYGNSSVGNHAQTGRDSSNSIGFSKAPSFTGFDKRQMECVPGYIPVMMRSSLLYNMF